MSLCPGITLSFPHWKNGGANVLSGILLSLWQTDLIELQNYSLSLQTLHV